MGTVGRGRFYHSEEGREKRHWYTVIFAIPSKLYVIVQQFSDSEVRPCLRWVLEVNLLGWGEGGGRGGERGFLSETTTPILCLSSEPLCISCTNTPPVFLYLLL